MPGFDAMRKQQEAFMKTVMGGLPGWVGSGSSGPDREDDKPASQDELDQIKKQLAELQSKLSKL